MAIVWVGFWRLNLVAARDAPIIAFTVAGLLCRKLLDVPSPACAPGATFMSSGVTRILEPGTRPCALTTESRFRNRPSTLPLVKAASWACSVCSESSLTLDRPFLARKAFASRVGVEIADAVAIVLPLRSARLLMPGPTTSADVALVSALSTLTTPRPCSAARSVVPDCGMNWKEPFSRPGTWALLLTVSSFTFRPNLAKIPSSCATHRKPKADEGPGVATVTLVRALPSAVPEAAPLLLDEHAARLAASATTARPMTVVRLPRVASSAVDLMNPPLDVQLRLGGQDLAPDGGTSRGPDA